MNNSKSWRITMLAVLLCFVLSVCQAGGAIGWGSKPPSSTDINSQNDQFLASSRHSDGGDLSQGEEKTWSWSDDDKDSDIGSSSSMTAMAESTSSAQSTSKTSSWWWPWSTSSTSEKEQQYEIIVGQKRKIENNTSLVNSDKEDISNSKNTNTNAALPEDLLEIPSSSSPPSVPSSQAQPAILVKIGQGLFDNLSPFMSQLIVTNMNNFELQDIEVECPIPLVGDIVFRAFNLKVANASVGPSSNLSIANDAIKLAFAGIKFNLGGEYAVSWGSQKISGIINTDSEVDVFGDLTVSNNGKGGIKTGLINLSTPFKKFDVSVSNTLLNWITSISNKIFGGIVKKIMGLVLSTFTRQIVIPTVNMVLSNQVSVGVSSNIGGSGISLSSAIVGQPTITAAEGLAFAISLNVVNGFSSSKGGALSRRNYQTQLLQQFSLRRRSLVSDGQIDVSTIKVFLPVAELEAEALDFIKPGSLKLLPSRTNSNTRIVEFK